MKGFILTSSLALIERYMEPGVVEKLNSRLQLESGGVYQSNSDYCDREFTRLFDTLADILHIQPDKIYKMFGIFYFAEMRASTPEWIETADSTFSALIKYDIDVLASLEKAFPGYVGSLYECTLDGNNGLFVDFSSTYLPPKGAEVFFLQRPIILAKQSLLNCYPQIKNQRIEGSVSVFYLSVNCRLQEWPDSICHGPG